MPQKEKAMIEWLKSVDSVGWTVIIIFTIVVALMVLGLLYPPPP